MKLKFFFILLLSLYIVNCAFYIEAQATIRFVSKSGTSTPPYTSWQTAADSIQKCINICSFGDTVYVANGNYKELIVMVPGLSLIGAGMDSCVIDMTDRTTYVYAVTMKDSCLIKGFNIKFCYNCPPGVRGLGIYMDFSQDTVKGCTVTYNRIDYPKDGIVVTEGVVKHNIINDAEFAIRCITFDQSRDYIVYIDSNYIAFYYMGIYTMERTKIEANDNIFLIKALDEVYGNILFNTLLSQNTRTDFNNNDIVKSTNNLLFRRAISNAFPGNFANNQFIAQYENVFYTAPANINNNNIIGSINGVHGDTTNVKYNNFLKTQNYPHDSTNISVDPMFVNDTSDYHLQMHSTLIDAGDPGILDKDGSRSDIGLYGGPNGEKYTYRDLAPKPPSNLTAIMDSGLVKLTWNKNTEADFSVYRVYRDTVPDFMYDTTKIIAVLSDTVYFDDPPQKFISGNYYYKITALDNTGHQSAPSEEAHINITGIPEAPPIVIEHYRLLNNYPNPFNSSTIIPYRLSEAGYVKLYVYDTKGELVRVLVNGYQSSGYYEVRFSPTNNERSQGKYGEEYWTGYNDDIASGMYIYQLHVRGEGDIPVFSGMGKMILLK